MKWQCKHLEDLKEVCVGCKPYLKAGVICLLKGDMGAGKTTFVAEFMRQLGFEDVSSPSFALVQEYRAALPVFHLDLYRLEGGRDVDMLDLDYYFSQRTHLVFVEWPEKMPEPTQPYVTLSISRLKDGSREFCLDA